MTTIALPPTELYAAIVDDDDGFVKQIDRLDETLPIRLRATTDPREVIDWVKRGEVSWLVCDLKMNRVDGIAVLEEAYRYNSDLTLALLTSHDLERQQNERLKRINAYRYRKDTGLLQLITDLSESQPVSPVTRPAEPESVVALRDRLQLYEGLHHEMVEDFVAQLRAIPDPNTIVSAGPKSFTVAELIDDVQNLRPRGVEHMRLWLRAFRTLRELGKE